MMSTNFKKNRADGFTLIEMLVYVVIMGALLAMVMNIYLSLGKAREKATVISEVERGGYTAMQTMTQSVRNAQSVVSPGGSATSSTLSLTVYEASSSPTTFSVVSSMLYMTEGSITAALTNSRVMVSNLVFSNLTASTTDGSIQIQFTLTAPATGHTSGYSTTFFGSAEVRNFQ